MSSDLHPVPKPPARPKKARAWNSSLSKPSQGLPAKRKTPRRGNAALIDEAYRDYIRGLPCLLEGRKGHVCRGRVEFAHVANKSRLAPDRGNGLPLCGLSGHREGSKSWHFLGERSWPEYWGIDPQQVAVELLADYERGEFPDVLQDPRRRDGFPTTSEVSD